VAVGLGGLGVMLDPITLRLRAPVLVGVPVKGPWLSETGTVRTGSASVGGGTLTCGAARDVLPAAMRRYGRVRSSNMAFGD
jgi:hypothetical protein